MTYLTLENNDLYSLLLESHSVGKTFCNIYDISDVLHSKCSAFNKLKGYHLEFLLREELKFTKKTQTNYVKQHVKINALTVN